MEDMAKAIMKLPEDVREMMAQKVMEGLAAKARESYPKDLKIDDPVMARSLSDAYDLGVQHGLQTMLRFLNGKITLEPTEAPVKERKRKSGRESAH